jgi:hypothetical protein
MNLAILLWIALAFDPNIPTTQAAIEQSNISVTINAAKQQLVIGEPASVTIAIQCRSQALRIMNIVGLNVLVCKADQKIPLFVPRSNNSTTQPTTQQTTNFYPGAIWPEVEIECPYNPHQVWLGETEIISRRIFPEEISAGTTKSIKKGLPGWAFTSGTCRVRAVLLKNGEEIASSPFVTISVGHNELAPATQPTSQPVPQ